MQKNTFLFLMEKPQPNTHDLFSPEFPPYNIQSSVNYLIIAHWSIDKCMLSYGKAKQHTDVKFIHINALGWKFMPSSSTFLSFSSFQQYHLPQYYKNCSEYITLAIIYFFIVHPWCILNEKKSIYCQKMGIVANLWIVHLKIWSLTQQNSIVGSK